MQLIEGVSTPPGRVRTFLEEPHKGTTPHSCTLIVYRNDLYDLLQFCSKSLRWGAGVKVILDEYENRTPLKFKWGFYLPESHPDFHLMAADQRQYYCRYFADSAIDRWTVIKVADSMEESDEECFSIEQSWLRFIELAEQGKNIVIDLSSLRSTGTENELGLVATGPIGKGKQDDPDAGSFFAIYRELANHLQKGDVASLLEVLGTLNDTLRRGGQYKNGIITSGMYWRNPHFLEYLNVPVTTLAGGHKKGARLCPEIVGNKGLLKAIAHSATEEGTFLAKIEKGVYDNVCVVGDTWINTSDGPRQVSDLVGKPFIAVVDGNQYSSTEQGFWSNGVRKILKLRTKDGYQVRLTPNHKLLKATRRHYRDPYVYEWTDSENLKPGDKIKLNNCRINPEWTGSGNREEGWLIGYLIGNGSISSNSSGEKITAQMPFWGEHRQQMLENTKNLISNNVQTYRNGSQAAYERSGYTIHREGRNEEQVLVTSTGIAKLAQSYGIVKGSKIPTKLVEKASSDFCKGFIQGLFDADAHVSTGNSDGSGKAIQFTQVNTETIFLVQRVLLRLGVKSSIYFRPSKGFRNFPDGLYKTRDALRLDITGATNIQQYATLIGFTKPDKISSLDTILQSYKKTQYREDFLAVVDCVEENGEEDVFDCTIQGIHCFDANGIIAHNCEGLFLPDRGTCLIWRVNIALCRTFEEIPEAFKLTTRELCNLHINWRKQVGKRAELFAPLEEDRQIGVDVLGLANALAYWGITYIDLTLALERFMEGRGGRTDADRLVFFLAQAYRQSTIVADEIMRENNFPLLERIHTIEPSQNHAYHCKDLKGFTTARSIFAPFGQKVRRVSNSQKNMVVKHGDVETAANIGPTLHQRFCELYQQLMELCGRAHAISFDWWEPITEEWIEDWLRSPLKTKYYTEHTRYNQEFLRKQAIAVCDVARPGECLACAD